MVAMVKILVVNFHAISDVLKLTLWCAGKWFKCRIIRMGQKLTVQVVPNLNEFY